MVYRGADDPVLSRGCCIDFAPQGLEPQTTRRLMPARGSLATLASVGGTVEALDCLRRPVGAG